MGWLTGYSDTNKIVDSDEEIRFPVANLSPGGTSQHRDDRMIHYRYVGMTYDAAVSCKAALHNPNSGVTASVTRENEGGAYTVTVVKITLGEWTDDA